MEIGGKIKRIRLKLGLTQEELADRCELSKGFISLLERDRTSPSIATLVDILESLGTNLNTFFSGERDEKLVFSEADTSVKIFEEDGYSIRWLVPGAQKNRMEPIYVELQPGASTSEQDPHEGEEFGFVLAGTVQIELGEKRVRARKNESFCFEPTAKHRLVNPGKSVARALWVSDPPSF